jgi:hypothetical protein
MPDFPDGALVHHHLAEHAKDGVDYLERALRSCEPELRESLTALRDQWRAVQEGHEAAFRQRYPEAHQRRGELDAAAADETPSVEEILERQGDSGDQSTEDLLEEYTHPKALRHRRR